MRNEYFISIPEGQYKKPTIERLSFAISKQQIKKEEKDN